MRTVRMTSGITQTVTKNRVRTDDTRNRSHLETHKDPLFKTFDGEQAGRPSEKAKQAHRRAVKQNWPEENWNETEPFMPAPHNLPQSLTKAFIVPAKPRRPKK